MFSARKVHFGLEDDEVVVAALLEDSNMIPHCELRTLLDGSKPRNQHHTTHSSDAEASFRIMN